MLQQAHVQQAHFISDFPQPLVDAQCVVSTPTEDEHLFAVGSMQVCPVLAAGTFAVIVGKPPEQRQLQDEEVSHEEPAAHVKQTGS